MSAITGIFYRTERTSKPGLIKEMNEKISHRGPDGSTVIEEDPIAFGHQMLFTTHESLNEKLPFQEHEMGLIINADARIDNRKELSNELDIIDKQDISDSYFILKAYEKWGEKCPEYLIGDFIFVIWDKNKEKLFCARDHMGVKPLYCYLDDDMFVFGTEIKALYPISEINFQINELKIAYFLSLIFPERRSTFYKKIFLLPAAYSISISSKTVKWNKYWNLDVNYKIEYDNDKAYVQEFKRIFKEAVNCRLRSAFPVGSMLSGGLDSSSISCIAQKILIDKGKAPLKTFSAYFNSVPNSNERDYIQKVVSSANFDSYHIDADKISPLSEINDFLYYADQPFIFPNTFMSWNIYRESKKRGVRVLLDGLEGDVTVSHGDGYLSDLARDFKFRKLLSETRYTSNRLGISQYEIFNQIFIKNFIPSIFKRNINKFRINKSKIKILKKELIESKQFQKNWRIISENNFKIFNAHEKHYNSITSAFFQYELEAVDAISSPFSLELRHPFFDKRLIEFCLAIPTEQKFSNGWDRFILRRAMFKILPNEIQWRENKGNLSHNFDQKLLNEKDILDDIITNKANLLSDYVDIENLQTIYDNYFSQNNSRDSIYVWNSLILALWLFNKYSKS